MQRFLGDIFNKRGNTYLTLSIWLKHLWNENNNNSTLNTHAIEPRIKRYPKLRNRIFENEHQLNTCRQQHFSFSNIGKFYNTDKKNNKHNNQLDKQTAFVTCQNHSLVCHVSLNLSHCFHYCVIYCLSLMYVIIAEIN